VIEDVDLGELSAVTVGHDSGGYSPGWHLDHLAVEAGGRRWLFPCHRWLDAGIADGATERRLEVATCAADSVLCVCGGGGIASTRAKFAVSQVEQLLAGQPACSIRIARASWHSGYGRIAFPIHRILPNGSLSKSRGGHGCSVCLVLTPACTQERGEGCVVHGCGLDERHQGRRDRSRCVCHPTWHGRCMKSRGNSGVHLLAMRVMLQELCACCLSMLQ
jgi:PLAT/LH2 domain